MNEQAQILELRFKIETLKSCISQLCDLIGDLSYDLYPTVDGIITSREEEIKEKIMRIQTQL